MLAAGGVVLLLLGAGLVTIELQRRADSDHRSRRFFFEYTATLNPVGNGTATILLPAPRAPELQGSWKTTGAATVQILQVGAEAALAVTFTGPAEVHTSYESYEVRFAPELTRTTPDEPQWTWECSNCTSVVGLENGPGGITAVDVTAMASWPRGTWSLDAHVVPGESPYPFEWRGWPMC